MANDEGSTPSISEPKSDAEEKRDTVDPIQQSEQELLSRYPQGLKPKLKSVAQRKISSGGMQYFDSGDYNAASQRDKSRIKDNPRMQVVRPPINPALSRVGGKPRGAPSSGLAATSVARSEQ